MHNKQRSRRAGTAPIKRPAEPAGVVFENASDQRLRPLDRVVLWRIERIGKPTESE
jgi:hypothetical protein